MTDASFKLGREKRSKVLTPEEIVIDGITKDLTCRMKLIDAGEKGRGVAADENITRGSFVAEYKYYLMYSSKEREKKEKEYAENSEGCYILEAQIPGGSWVCLDATRNVDSWARYINHGPVKEANIKLFRPLKIDGNWHACFLATRSIRAGEELLYDYGKQPGPPDFMRVKKNPTNIRQSEDQHPEPKDQLSPPHQVPDSPLQAAQHEEEPPLAQDTGTSKLTQDTSRQANSYKQCALCNNNSKVGTVCTSCGLMCSQCMYQHTKMKCFAEHKYFNLEEVLKSIQSLCGLCSAEAPCEMNCSSCNTNICSSCVEQHKRMKFFDGHKLSPAAEGLCSKCRSQKSTATIYQLGENVAMCVNCLDDYYRLKNSEKSPTLEEDVIDNDIPCAQICSVRRSRSRNRRGRSSSLSDESKGSRRKGRRRRTCLVDEGEGSSPHSSNNQTRRTETGDRSGQHKTAPCSSRAYSHTPTRHLPSHRTLLKVHAGKVDKNRAQCSDPDVFCLEDTMHHGYYLDSKHQYPDSHVADSSDQSQSSDEDPGYRSSHNSAGVRPQKTPMQMGKEAGPRKKARILSSDENSGDSCNDDIDLCGVESNDNVRMKTDCTNLESGPEDVASSDSDSEQSSGNNAASGSESDAARCTSHAGSKKMGLIKSGSRHRRYNYEQYRKYRQCPMPNCKSRPQKKLSNHFTKYHPELSESARTRLLKSAKEVSKSYASPDLGQTKLEFKESPADIPVEPKGTSRSLSRFPLSHPELELFKTHLMSLDGKKRSESAAQAIVNEISKILHFGGSEELEWANVVNRKKLKLYLEKTESLGVGVEGRLTKLERLRDCLDYLKHYHNEVDLKKEIEEIEIHLSKWKSVYRNEKQKLIVHRLEKMAELDLSLDAITQVVDNPEMWVKFEQTINDLKHGLAVTDETLKSAMGSVMISIVLKSYQRPGAVCNCTIKEYQAAQVTDGILIIRVKEHKTDTHGTAKLTVDTPLKKHLDSYFKYVRPKLVSPGADIPNLFILPGGSKVSKLGNLVRFLQNNLDIQIPTCTMARKIAATNAARSMDDQSNALVSKQMSHSDAVGKRYYRAIGGQKDTALAYRKLEALRLGQQEQAEPQPSSSKPNTKGWSNNDTSHVKKVFKKFIEAGQTPSTRECAQICNLPDKTPKQIQDKVRTILRQLSKKEESD